MGTDFPTHSDEFVTVDALRQYDRSRLEENIRRHCQSCYLGQDIVLGRVLAKYKMFLSANDISLTPHLLLDGFWEIWITQAIARFVYPAMVAVDVGANVGYYTLLLSDLVGENGHVLAFEPHPAIFQLLNVNVEVNGFTQRTRALNKAVTDSDGNEVRLYTSRLRQGDSSIVYSLPDPSDVMTMMVQTVTLDTILSNSPPVDFIKIDAEGAEWLIWNGMLKTIRSNEKVMIAMEFSPSRYNNPSEFLDAILKEGFKLRYIDYDSQVKEITADHVLSHQDWWMLFLRRY